MTQDGGSSDALAATLQSDGERSTPRPASTEWPAAIGRFQIERKLGEGGMGVVLL